MASSDVTSGMMQGGQQGASMGSAAGPWGALFAGVGGAIAGGWMGIKSAEAKERAQLEQQRRERNETAKVMAHGYLSEGASGVLVGQSSMRTHLDKMAAEFQRNHDWAMRQYALGADLEKKANTYNTMASIGSSLFRFAESNNWWQQRQQNPETPAAAPSDAAPGSGSGAPFA